MIEGFINETERLNEYEIKMLVPVVAKGLAGHIGKNNEVTSSHICARLTDKGYRITAPRLRKIINYIRITGQVKCLIATSKGYYVATTREEMETYTESLRCRAAAINAVVEAMVSQTENSMLN